MLRIAINALYLIPGGVGGTEIYLRSLLNALAAIDKTNEYFIYVNAETAETPLVTSPNFHTIKCNVRASSRPGRILWEQSVLPFLLKRRSTDVLFNPGFTAPVVFGSRSVTVFHDLQHKRHPEFFRSFDLPFWNLLLWGSSVRSRRLIAVSQATADDLVHYYPYTQGKIAVIPHGVDPEFFRIGERRRQARQPLENYILTVSTLHPHKNIGRLLEAFRIFRSSHPEYHLVVAGLKGFATEDLESIRRHESTGDSVAFTGWIPREELYSLFERARGYIAPSEFEGFGMPIIEALAAGIPAACSAIRPFDEIVGDAAAHFDPRHVKEIAEAMELVTMDEACRARAAVAGPLQARQFDWDHTAARTLKEFENLSYAISAK